MIVVSNVKGLFQRLVCSISGR